MQIEEQIQELISKINLEELKEISGDFLFKVSDLDTQSILLKINQGNLSLEKSPNQTEQAAASLAIEADQETWQEIFEKKVNTQMAFMLGKIKLSGDTSLALKLAQILKIA